MPEDRWWSWIDRLGRLKIQGLQLEQEALAALRDLRAELRELEGEEEEAAPAPTASR